MQTVSCSKVKRLDESAHEDHGTSQAHEAETDDTEEATRAQEERQVLLVGLALGFVIGGVFLIYVILWEAKLFT
jgi:hypothetical protein